jgi:amino acid permease
MTEKITNITVYIILFLVIVFAGYSIFTKIHNSWKSYIWEMISIVLIINAYFQYRFLRISQTKIKRYENRFFGIE